MNVLLVYPRYPDTFWSFKNVLRFISKKVAYPPLGLLTIASMLPVEWNKKLVDVNIVPLKDRDIEWADMVFISAMLIQGDGAQEIIKKCKSQGKTVVAGGPAFTTSSEKFYGVDHFVLNEAEVTLPLFLKDLEVGTPRNVYASSVMPDITETPIPLWSLINLKDYATMALQYSRGCPFDCEFCDIIVLNGKVPRIKTPEQFINEVQSLYDAGWKGPLFIVDDNFIGNKTAVKKMLPSLIKWQKEHNYPFRLLTEASVNLAADEELMKLMNASNFDKVFLGLETPSKDSLKDCGKKQNLNVDLVDAVKTIQKNGMQVMGGFIVGFDRDTENIFEDQIKFIQEIGVVTAMVGMLNALPQTKLWHRLRDEGRLLGDTTGENTGENINFIPKMGKDKLIEGYKKIISTIYSPKNYYQRIHKFIKNFNPNIKTRIKKEDIQAFIRSIWEIGVLSRSRLLYWKLLIMTCLTKINALPEAIELAIYGLHFENVARKLLNT